MGILGQKGPSQTIILDPLNTWHGPHHKIYLFDISLGSYGSIGTIPTRNYNHLGDIGGKQSAIEPPSDMGMGFLTKNEATLSRDRYGPTQHALCPPMPD